MKKQDKNSDTGLRILEVLKLLLQKNLTKHELISFLKEKNNIENVHTQEAFIKYFNTLEALGFIIKKEGRIYKLANSFIKLYLTSEEEKLILKLLQNTNKLYDCELEEAIYNILIKLEKYTNIEIENQINLIEKENKKLNDNNIRKNIIKTIMNYIEEGQLVSLTFNKNTSWGEFCIVEIKKVTEKNDKIYLTCFNSILGRNKRISFDSIKEINQLSQKIPDVEAKNPVIFELYGRLAKTYKLKSSENVLDFGKDRITISNTEEESDTLIIRLLKYGENCKVVSPHNFQSEFLRITNSILTNLLE